jgi:hypothetical protein
MANQAVVLEDYDTMPGKRVMTVPYANVTNTLTTRYHGVERPFLVIDKRNTPNFRNPSAVVRRTISVLSYTKDNTGAVQVSPVRIDIDISSPIDYEGADKTDVLTVARDIIAGDEFEGAVLRGEWLLPHTT